MKRLAFLFCSLLPMMAFSQDLKVSQLRCGYRTDPAGVEDPAPKLSWEVISNHKSILQTGYRVLLSEDTVSLLRNEGSVWDSRKVLSDASIQVAYTGPALHPAQTYYWRVMVWDNKGDSSRWSRIAVLQTGLYTTADWKGAQWVAYQDMPDSDRILPAPSVKGVKKNGPFRDTLPLFRKEFSVSRPLKRATAFVCGLGHFEMSLNGKKVGDHFLDPGWTAYDKEALYVPFDITAMLQQGANAVGVILGNGFYYIPRERYHKLIVAYGYPKLLMRIRLEYADGSTEDVVSDPSWKTAPGPLTFSSTYGGEDYDARREMTGWDQPGFRDKGWKPVVMVGGPQELHAQSEEPVKVFEHFLLRSVKKLGGDVWVYDLGQNASGIPFLAVKGARGRVIRIVPAELLSGDSANQKATGKPNYFEYTLKGEGIEQWQPRFSYYGFRYLQVEGGVPEGQPNPDGLPVIMKVEGLHIHNAAERAGHFSCSSELFCRTDTLIDWAIRSNMVSVLTDCPHREKLGWLEEAHLMGSSVRYNYDIAALYRKIIHDMMSAQTKDGLIPEIAPEFTVFPEPFRDSPEWGSSSILVPWYLYQWYGDRETLAESYGMMKAYAGYLSREAKGHILYEGLSDWYDLGPEHPGVSQLTPRGLTATAIYYYDLSILSRIARLLGKEGDAVEYEGTAAAVKAAFNAQFFNPQTNEYGTGSQAANAMAVYMGLVEATHKDSVVANIVKDIRNRNNALTAGDIGYRYLLKVLADEGRSDVIFDMNSRNDVPGYGYQLKKGATALTESWQALPSVSNNHFMLGHIMEWFYTDLAGIRESDTSVGFRDIVLRPEMVGGIRWADGDYHSPYGLVSSHWKKEGKTFDWSVTVPANACATMYLPVPPGAVVTEGWRDLDSRKDIVIAGREKGRLILKIGSGNYNFRVQEGNAVSEAKMKAIYEAVKTPYKYGLVMAPSDNSKKMDCPSIFRKGNEWYMIYLIFDGRGYETWLATSADLLHWESQGRLMSFTDTTGADSARWDANQKAGYIALEDPAWGGGAMACKNTMANTGCPILGVIRVDMRRGSYLKEWLLRRKTLRGPTSGTGWIIPS